jgi:hypothetical protein
MTVLPPTPTNRANGVGTVLLAYDHIPNGWDVPTNNTQWDQIFAVKVTVQA